jgi:hypothetical protein
MKLIFFFKFNTFKWLRITLQLCKASRSFKVIEREKRGEKKKLLLELLCAMKANTRRPTLLKVTWCFGCSRRRLPTATRRRHTRRLKDACIIFFFIIERPEHPWPHRIIPRKSRLKNLKCSLTLEKNDDSKGYVINYIKNIKI